MTPAPVTQLAVRANQPCEVSIDGTPVGQTPIAARAIAIDVERLRATPRVVAVAAGVDKAAAIQGALRSGVVRILVTDRATARAILGEAA